jgi:hypothetical protein
MSKMFSPVVVLLVLPLGGCGLVTTQSVYEGFRTQQRIKDAGSKVSSDALGSYGAYQKEREKGKSAPEELEQP